MDRALDDIIGDRRHGGFRPRSDRERDNRPPRDGVRKPVARREEPRNLDSDWVHDRYDDDETRGPRRGDRGGRGSFFDGSSRRGPSYDANDSGTKIKVDNLHYDLTEEDVRELFSRKGDVSSVQLLYDRQDRSRGIAYVTMMDSRDARDAVRDFDGANANGQPIKVTMFNSYPPSRPRNPFDTAERPAGKSLFERVEPKRSRSESPQPRHRRSEFRGRDNVDRYEPGGSRNDSRRRSPRGRGRGGDRRGGGSRRPGERRGEGRDDGERRKLVQGRPRKTQEELDAEMEDYWGAKESNGTAAAAPNADAGAAVADNGDVDMVE